MKALREIRRQRGLSQQGLSRATGIAQNSISEIELGHREPRGSTLRKLAEALDVEIADLLREPALPKKVEPPRERPVEPTAGGSSFEERRPSVRYWRVKLEALATHFREAEKELRNADLNTYPNSVIDAAVWTNHELPSLSREADEVRKDPGVIAAVEQIRSASASVERMLKQRLGTLDDAHAREIRKFMNTEEDLRLSGDERAHDAS